MEGYLPEETCRTCLQKSDELTSLLSKDDDTGLTLLEKLCFCASMQVVVSEHTPSNACPRCVRCISEYYDFKQRCELSEKTLEVLCSDPVTNTKTKIKVDYEEVEVGDSTVVIKTECDDFDLIYTDTNNQIDYGEEEDADSAESDILDLFCDEGSKSTPCIDGEEEIDGTKLTPSHEKQSKHPCKSSFTTAERLQTHKKFSDSTNRHSCDYCGVSFQSFARLRIHRAAIHKDLPKYICETCGKSYTLDSTLRIHIEENHSAELKVYECNVCGRTYNRISSLNSHKRSHFPVDPRYVCDHCGLSFRKRYFLARHLRIKHEKPHACDLCDKRFGYKLELLKHKAHHVNEMAKPYGCELCERRFSTKAAVVFHVSTLHKGKKHLKCDVCGMEFYNRSHYAGHYSGHTGVKPYKCNGCRKGFTNNATLKQHKKKCASLLALTQQ